MSELQVELVPVLSDNYVFVIIYDHPNVAVIDPGEERPVWNFLQQKGLKLTTILCTHHHPDHTGGIAALKKQSNCTLVGAKHDQKRIRGIDKTVEEGDTLTLGNFKARVIETWGHTRGHISYHFKENKLLFCGDTLFSVGCGRLFEGTAQEMYESLQKINALDPQTTIYCGHEYTQGSIRFALSIEPGNEDLKRHSEKVNELRSKNLPTIPSTLSLEQKINPFLRSESSEIRNNLKMQNNMAAEVFAEIRRRKDYF